MKKITKYFFGALIAACLSNTYAKSLTIEIDSWPTFFSDQWWDEPDQITGPTIDAVKALAKNLDIEIYSSDEITERNDCINSLEQKLKSYKQNQKSLKSDLEDAKKYGYTLITPDSYKTPEDYNAVIEKTQKELDEAKKIPEKPYYPLVEIKVESDYRYSSQTDLLEITAHLYKNKNKESSNSYIYIRQEYFSSDKDIVDFLSQLILAYIPLLDDTKQENLPSLIDAREFSIDKYTGSNNSTPTSLAARDDFSFVLRSGDHIADYNPSWEETKSYDEEISKIKTNQAWTLACVDGKTVLFGNTDSPVVYAAQNGKLIKKSTWKFTKGMVGFRFDCQGTPYTRDLTNGLRYLPQPDGKSSVTYPAKRSLTAIFDSTHGPNSTYYFKNDCTVFVFDLNSDLQKIIQLESELQHPSLAKVTPDGNMFFMAYSSDYSHCYLFKTDSQGRTLYKYEIPPEIKYPDGIMDYKNGVFYIYGTATKAVGRFAEYGTVLPNELRKLVDFSGAQNESLADQAKIYLSLADTYYENNSFEAALEQYDNYLTISPNDFEAAEKRQRSENAMNKKSAVEAYNKTLDLYDEYGEETAKESYSSAIKLLEKLRKNTPWDGEVEQMYVELRQIFNPSESLSTKEIPALSVEKLELTSLYPALLNNYASMNSGYLTIKNNSDVTVRNVKVSSFVRRYMDYAAEGDVVASIEPGQEALVSIKTPLNKSVLSLTDSVSVQMQFTVSWEQNASQKSFTVNRPVTIYSKNAMTWSDTAMLSCFVQPNNPAVQNFVFLALSQKTSTVLSKNVTRAMQISNALASIPLTYVSDPNTPSALMVDNKFSVDTVRFPDETLSLKGGDCDDMTTLFCSALESTGIPTALITLPGHIFAAFDSGFAYSPVWANLPEEFSIWVVDGRVWIPVETTSLSKGFEQAWKTASSEIASAKDNELEIVTLKEAWQTYSSVAPDAKSKTENYSLNKSDTFNNQNSKELTDMLQQALAATNTKNSSAEELNAIAKLNYQMGNTSEAIKLLELAIKKDAECTKAYSNLAKIYTNMGDSKKAITYQNKADALYLADTKAEKNGEQRASQTDAEELEE